MKKITLLLAFSLLFAACSNPQPLQYADDAAVTEENTLVTDTTEQKIDTVKSTNSAPIAAPTTASWDTVCTVKTPKVEPLIKPEVKETKVAPKKNVSTSHTYIVQKGDTKYSISKKLNSSVEKLIISNPNWKQKNFVLTPGQTVYYWKTEK